MSADKWLQSGWILQLPQTGHEPRYWLGWGDRVERNHGDLDSGNGIWTPHFFGGLLDDYAGECFSTLQMHEFSENELIDWLRQSAPAMNPTKNPKVATVVWQAPTKENFAIGFERLQQAFKKEAVKKAVPVAFARGIGTVSNLEHWLFNRIWSALSSAKKSGLRVYGEWKNGRGVIGATPESLFSIIDDQFTTMAVAATRPASQCDELMSDPKERDEHAIVVSDIAETLGLAGLSGVKQSQTKSVCFGEIAHLVTEFEARLCKEFSVEKLVKFMHPTPALGLSPREPKLALLREVHNLVASSIPREGFGAPFVVRMDNRIEALVAIRQLRWSFSESDNEVSVLVGSGCGVVPESRLENEWRELALKRRTVARVFGLSEEVAVPWETYLLESVIQMGVETFIVCAGARNATLVRAIEKISGETRSDKKKICIESFFDERSASFYALGRSRRDNKPVAIVTTSGTAVTELHSAIAEADHSGVPLIAITADRPRRLRGSGAPQSILQPGLFRHFVEREWDLEKGEGFDGFAEWSYKRPLHINICFEDSNSSPAHRIQNANSCDGGSLVIVGRLEPNEREAVAEYLKAAGMPCLLEGPSGLRGDKRLRDIELCSGDLLIQRWVRAGEVNSVLRIGGVPTTRVWRDFDEPHVATQIKSVSALRFTGLGRGEFVQADLAVYFNQELVNLKSNPRLRYETERRWLEDDRKEAKRLERLLQIDSGAMSASEPVLMRALSEIIPQDALVYIGNSLPIREWDLAATREKVFVVEANRGVNGIDGQISTALGLSRADRDSWIIVGDLTALYDLAGLWPAAQGSLNGHRLRIVVINNSGGRIFTRVFGKIPGGAKAFENEHHLTFEGWAQLWKIDYLLLNIEDLENLVANQNGRSLSDHVIIELRPSEAASAAFWLEYERLGAK